MDKVNPTRPATPVDLGGVALHEFGPLLAGSLLLLLLIGLSEAVPWPWLQSGLRPLRLLLGLTYLLFVPGYCLTAALFPERDDLDGVERAGLSLGLSVAWVPVLVLVLDRLPWGLRLWPLAAGFFLSILLFAAVALWRRSQLPPAAAYMPDLTWRPGPWWRTLPRFEQRIYLLCAGAVLLAGVAAVLILVVPSPDDFMTEFYVLGSEGRADSYPRAAAVDEPLTVTMGIANRERREQTYRVEVWAVDPWTEDRQELVGTAGPFTLVPGEKLEQPVDWRMPWAGDDLQVAFRLFTGEERLAEPYRHLLLWLDVEEGR